MHGMGGWGTALEWVFWIALAGAIAGFVIWALGGRKVRTIGGGDAGRREESALEILRKRCARGEVGHEEFEERKRRLKD